MQRGLIACGLLAFVLCLVSAADSVALAQTGHTTGEGGWVWWEAEDPVSETFPPAAQSPFQEGSLDFTRLSGGDWISGDKGNTGEPYSAAYEITVPKHDTYTFWIRKAWHHALFTWEFEDGPKGEVTRDAALFDYTPLRRKLGATWMDAGQVKLAAGKHRFSFTQTGSDKPGGGGYFGIDCFALVPFPWKPSGRLKPGEKLGLEEEGCTGFEPDVDTFTNEVLVDLRDRNHTICGELGRLVVRDGDFFWAEGPHKPVRFWGQVVGRSAIVASDQAQEAYVRRMAKLGVNMIRLHARFHGGVEGDALAISDHYLDRFDHFVATCRKNGVYFMVNTFYDHWIHGSQVGGGHKDREHPNGWQFIHPEGRALWRRWTGRLLDRENPYTGMRNSEDPTIAIIQLSNEDNYFFHNFQPYDVIPVETMEFMEQRYAKWLREEYGSLEKAKAGWQHNHPRDDLDGGRLGLLTVHHLTNSGQRGRDQAAFQVHDYRAITDGFIAHLRDMGYEGVVNNGNWLSADARYLEPLDKMANMNASLLSRHGVTWTAHEKLDEFWHVKAGDYYASRSGLKEPWELPWNELHYNDHATMVCEPKTTMPNRFRAEWLVLGACWGALQGMDAQMHFAGSLNWLTTTARWGIDEPTMMGQSPALALIYREGLVAQAPVVIQETLSRQALLDLQGAAFHPISSISRGEIQPRDLALLRIEEGRGPGLNPLMLMTGSLQRNIVDDPTEAGLRIDANVEQCVDAEAKTVRSVDGQLHLDWGIGLLRIQAARAQGAVGFLKESSTIELADMVIDCENEYASIVCVALDGKPLAESRRMLLTAVTEDFNYGWKTERATLKPRRNDSIQGLQVVDVGRSPIQHRRPAGTVRFTRADARSLRVTAVDWNGYPVAEHGTAKHIELGGDAISYVIQK